MLKKSMTSLLTKIFSIMSATLDSPTQADFSALFAELRACYSHASGEGDICESVTSVGGRLERLLARLRGVESAELVRECEGMAVTLWNDTVNMKVDEDEGGNSRRSLLLLRALALTAFICVPGREMRPEKLIKVATMAYKVGSGWLDHENTQECRLRAANALAVARDTYRRLCHLYESGAVSRDSLVQQVHSLALPTLLLKLELAEVSGETEMVDDNLPRLKECLTAHEKEATLVVIRTFNRAVSLFEAQQIDRAVLWARCSRDAVCTPTLNLQEELGAKVCRLLATALLDRGRKEEGPEALEMARKANRLVPCLSGLYLQLQLALEQRSDQEVGQAAGELFNHTPLSWQVAEAAADSLMSGLDQWPSETGGGRREMLAGVSAALQTRFADRVCGVTLASLRLRLLLFAGLFADARRLLEEVPRLAQQDGLVSTDRSFPHALLWRRADHLFASGHFEEAGSWFEASLALLPLHSPPPTAQLTAQLARNAAACRLNAGQLEAASRSLETAARLQPRDRAGLLLLLRLRAAQKRAEDVLECADAAESLSEPEEALRFAAQTAADNGLHEVATTLVTRLLKRSEGDVRANCLAFLGKCRLDISDAPVDVSDLLSFLETFVDSGRRSDDLAAVSLELGNRAAVRGHRWRLCRVAALIADCQEMKKAGWVQASVEALRCARESEDPKMVCSVAVDMISDALSRSQLALSLSERRLLVGHRVEAMVRSEDPRLLAAVKEAVSEADDELCARLAALLFYHRQTAFTAADEVLRWIAQRAQEKGSTSETVESYQHLIALHVERYEDCPGDPNNRTLAYADELQQCLDVSKERLGENTALQWLLVSLWNIGVRYMAQDRADGLTKVGLSLSSRFCSRALALCARTDTLQARYGDLMEEFYSRLLQMGGNVREP